MEVVHAANVNEFVCTNRARDCLTSSSRSYRLSASETHVTSFILFSISNFLQVYDFTNFLILFSISNFLLNNDATFVRILQTRALLLTLRTPTFDLSDPSLDTQKTVFMLAAIKGSLLSLTCIRVLKANHASDLLLN